MNKLSVFYVDDDQDLREVATFSLQLDPDLDVRVAGGGAEALTLLQGDTWAPDVILLDVMMPDMDGPGVLARLRNTSRFADTPVVFITARVQPQEVIRFKSLGAAGIIAKPFDPARLAAEVRSFATSDGG